MSTSNRRQLLENDLKQLADRLSDETLRTAARRAIAAAFDTQAVPEAAVQGSTRPASKSPGAGAAYVVHVDEGGEKTWHRIDPVTATTTKAKESTAKKDGPTTNGASQSYDDSANH
ncbi:MAG TPA: hypothetical protein VF669_10350 [Tepidisphaeraceae bacterium]|jgi:hypothetical protein